MEAIIHHAGEADSENLTVIPEHFFVRREVTILRTDLRGFTSIAATLPTGTVIAIYWY